MEKPIDMFIVFYHNKEITCILIIEKEEEFYKLEESLIGLNQPARTENGIIFDSIELIQQPRASFPKTIYGKSKWRKSLNDQLS